MKLSIVIPTLDESINLPSALASLPANAEIVVSDGGSSDPTPTVAARHDARVVSGSPGRAAQMNRGATASTGDVLLFLHADCRLGPRASAAIASALSDPAVVGGSFRLRIADENGPEKLRYRLIAGMSNARATCLGAPYGDQAVFCRRDAFERVGGFPELLFMEDVAFVRKLKRVGRLARVDETVTTGQRHWTSLGPFATTVLNWTMVSLFTVGVSPERLAPVYFRLRGRKRPEPSSSKAYV